MAVKGSIGSMKNKYIKILQIIPIVISVFLFAVGLVLDRVIKDNCRFTYENGKIVVHSWRNAYVCVCEASLLIIAAILGISIIICVFSRKIKKVRNILLSAADLLLCSAIIFITYVSVDGLWDRSEYDPECYEFTDGNHSIVIEEMSFLLMGESDIYQIEDGKNAFLIGSFTTDDGGRNKGKYDLEWHDDYVIIRYNYYDLSNSIYSEKVEFV